MTGASGFSLLELIIVLSLAAVLAAISVLSHQAMQPSLNLSSATRQVVMDLKVARIRAVTRNTNYRVVFADESDRYQPQYKNGNAYADDGRPIQLPHGIVVAACSARDSAIAFRPRGNATSFGTVTLRNGTGDVRHIIVDIAGQVRVE